MRPALLYTFKHRIVVKLPTFRDNLPVPSLPLKRGPVSPETSVTNYQSMLCKTPEDRISALMMLGICEIFYNRHREEHIFLMGVHEIKLTCIP
jgi:hypothetical protein